MSGFIKKSIGTLTLGEKLKKLRSEKRISLNEVSKSTRIQVKYLECLEEGKYDQLPADVYAKGFLKNYAEFLGVDENILVRLYEKERGIKRNLEKNQLPPGKRKKQSEFLDVSSFVLTPKIIITGLVAILVFGGFFYLYKEVGSFASAPRLVLLNPPQNAVVDGNSVVIEGVTDRNNKLFINDQPILVGDEGKFRENLTLQSGENVINVKAVNQFDKEVSEVLKISSNFQEQKESDDSENGKEETALNQNPVEIEIRVNPGPVWLSVESDGNLVWSGTMLTGSVQTFRAEEKININSGKANATFVRFNGKDIGALGETAGAVRGVVFTKDTKY